MSSVLFVSEFVSDFGFSPHGLRLLICHLCGQRFPVRLAVRALYISNCDFLGFPNRVSASELGSVSTSSCVFSVYVCFHNFS